MGTGLTNNNFGQGAAGASCAETASTPVTADTDACAGVIGTDLSAATACEAVMTATTTDAADMGACTYTSGVHALVSHPSAL